MSHNQSRQESGKRFSPKIFYFNFNNDNKREKYISNYRPLIKSNTHKQSIHSQFVKNVCNLVLYLGISK